MKKIAFALPSLGWYSQIQEQPPQHKKQQRCFGFGHPNLSLHCLFYKNNINFVYVIVPHRYIQRAGEVGCFSRYPLIVKQAELKWAEKGPRRSGGNNGSTMMSPRSRSSMTPVTPRAPNRAHNISSSPNSFVMNSSSYSPYSPTHRHHLPF